jgi:hypothetical protein
MKRLKIFLAVVVLTVFILPDWACPQVLVVCRRFVADQSCYKCSDHFYVNSEDEAQRRCDKLGAQPFYFPGIGPMAFWMRGNCSCQGIDPAP